MSDSEDIVTELAKLCVAFRRLNLEPPEAIILKTHEDGVRLLHELTHERVMMLMCSPDGRYGRPIEHPDGSVWMEIEIYGLKIRWPANRLAMASGGYRWI